MNCSLDKHFMVDEGQEPVTGFVIYCKKVISEISGHLLNELRKRKLGVN